MSIHKLKTILGELSKDDLNGIYNCFWSDGSNYSKEDLREHISRYILTFYKMASYKESCKEKCYFLIKQIEDMGE